MLFFVFSASLCTYILIFQPHPVKWSEENPNASSRPNVSNQYFECTTSRSIISVNKQFNYLTNPFCSTGLVNNIHRSVIYSTWKYTGQVKQSEETEHGGRIQSKTSLLSHLVNKMNYFSDRITRNVSIDGRGKLHTYKSFILQRIAVTHNAHVLPW